jgi:hypothetical protein
MLQGADKFFLCKMAANSEVFYPYNRQDSRTKMEEKLFSVDTFLKGLFASEKYQSM